MVKLSLADQNVSDRKLSFRLSKPFFHSIRPEHRQLHGNVRTGDGEAGADGGNKLLISPSLEGSLISSFLPIM